MSSSLGCRKALCQTGWMRDGQMTRDLFNSDLVDEWPSSNMKYLSELVLPVLLMDERNIDQQNRFIGAHSVTMQKRLVLYFFL